MTKKEMNERYLKLMEDNPSLYKNTENIRIEKNMETIENYEQKHGVKIGVVYESKYNLLVVDLLHEEGKGYYTYERIISAASGKAIVAVAKCKEKFVLLHQYRYPINDCQFAFVRGFGESGLSGEKNTAKEVLEEIGAQAGDITYLGEVYSDSGLCAKSVSVYLCNVDNMTCPDNHEGIKSILLVSEEELEEMINEGKITDGFTLSALLLYRSFCKRHP